uniref:Uncharacterized protein n=1 Tax=Anguilla anguilla TaxID=7936 RepID=A0A0E9PLS5_ANGAN
MKTGIIVQVVTSRRRVWKTRRVYDYFVGKQINNRYS